MTEHTLWGQVPAKKRQPFVTEFARSSFGDALAMRRQLSEQLQRDILGEPTPNLSEGHRLLPAIACVCRAKQRRA